MTTNGNAAKKRRFAIRAAFVAVTGPFALGGTAGCQVVGHITSRTADPIVEGCALPAGGSHHYRLASFRPTPERVDFCVRSAGSGAFRRPMLQDVGAACPHGLEYAQATKPIATDSPRIDVRVVAADDVHCTTALAEASNVQLDPASTSTLAFATSADGNPTVAVMPETARQNQPTVRFANMMLEPVRIAYGITEGDVLPTRIVAGITTPIQVGTAAPLAESGAFGSVSERGYVTTPQYRAATVGASVAGESDALLAVPLPTRVGAYSLYGVGSRGDAAHPARGLLCEDDVASASTADDASPLAKCTLSNPPSVTVTTLNLNLVALGGQAEKERWGKAGEYIIGALRNAAPSDFLCLTEVGRTSDQQTLIDALKDLYPYNARGNTNLDSPPGDPHDLTGKQIENPTVAPCAGVPPASMDQAYACLAQSCTATHDDTGVVEDPDCTLQSCAGDFFPLARASRCLGCAITNMLWLQPIGKSKTSCETDARDPYLFDGSSPSLLLSRIPLDEIGTYVLPSTMFRKTAVYATAQLDGKQKIRVFCSELTPPISTGEIPYFGQFGAGQDGNGWANEETLQAQQLVGLVKRMTSQDNVPAIITGDFQTSIEYREGDQVVVGATQPTTPLQVLIDGFIEAVPDRKRPECTLCPAPTNPFGKDPPGLWTTHTFLHGTWPVNAVLSSEVVFKENVVPYNGGLAPISRDYGYSARIQRPRL